MYELRSIFLSLSFSFTFCGVGILIDNLIMDWLERDLPRAGHGSSHSATAVGGRKQRGGKPAAPYFCCQYFLCLRLACVSRLQYNADFCLFCFGGVADLNARLEMSSLFAFGLCL